LIVGRSTRRGAKRVPDGPQRGLQRHCLDSHSSSRTGALQINNAKEVACCTRVDCARRLTIMFLGKDDIGGMRRHAFRIDRSSMDASKRDTSQRATRANNGYQDGIGRSHPNAFFRAGQRVVSREMPSVIRITPPPSWVKTTLVSLHPNQHRHLHNSLGLCGIALAIFVACGRCVCVSKSGQSRN
jgi:hypothetical protein